jgi:AcrR family transcriptional regulator
VTRTPKPQEPENDGVIWQNSSDRDEQHNRKRRLILKTAARIFARNGFQKTTIDEIAEALQVTKPTIYYYFKNKEDLLFQITRLALGDLDRAVSSSEHESASGLDKLREFCRIYGAFILTDIGACTTVVSDTHFSPAFRRRARTLKKQFDLRIHKIIDEGRRDRSMSIDDPRIFAAALFGAMNWAPQWFDPKGRLSAERVAMAIFEIFDRAAKA